MKITDVQAAQIDSHRFMLVKITTDEGIVGIGETSGLTGARQWIGRFRSLLVGENPFDVQRIVTQLLWGKQSGQFLTYMGDEEETPVESWLKRYGASGASLCQAATRAVSGVEMALIDIVGKALQTPAYNLLGGKYRERVRMYADLAGAEVNEPAAWRERGQEIRELGFTAVKFDVDLVFPELHADPWNRSLSNREISRTAELLAAVREGLGWDADIAVDAHGQYNVADMIRLGRELEPLKLMWLEDPLPDFNPEALRAVREKTNLPIACGELFQTLFECRPYIDSRAVDILHPDPRMCGGLLEFKRIADYADAHYIPCAAHSGASPYGTIAMAHAMAAVRCFVAQEYHWHGLSWVDGLVNLDSPLIRNGYLELPDKPGFGVEINEPMWAERGAVFE